MGNITKKNPQTEINETPSVLTSIPTEKNPKSRLLIIILITAIIILSTLVIFFSLNYFFKIKKQQDVTNPSNTTASENETYFALSNAVVRGKALSGDNCSKEGSIELTFAPMDTNELSVIIPYGLMVGGHVTPIDHQYYWGKVQMGDPDMYNVLSPGNGKLVQLGYRDRSGEGRKIKGDYRGVIMYTCTFFSYFDLVTSMDPSIASQLPQNWEKEKGNINTDIQLKAGQVVGKVGGQSLDFAVWDTTKQLSQLLVPIAYDNAELWKLSTVPPLDYFSDTVKASILPFYVKETEPRDGKLAYDIDGMLSGNWFLQNTNGYLGYFSNEKKVTSSKGYWFGHLSFAPDHVDNSSWIFSIGDLNGTAQQFSIVKSKNSNPDNVSKDSGLVKYELMDINYADGKNKFWRGERVANGVHIVSGAFRGVVLVQMLGDRQIKIEVFLNKKASQVVGFTNDAKIYDRGDNAIMVDSNTRM